MLSSVVTIMKVETSIFINGLLYFLKKLPILKSLLKTTNYSFMAVKEFIGYVALLYNLIWSSLKGILLPLIFISVPQLILGEGQERNPMILILFFYLLQRLLSSSLLELSNQKFIMVKELRMNPRDYSHAFLLKKELFKFLGRTLAFLILGGALGMNLSSALIISLSATMMAMVSEALHLFIFSRKSFVLEEHSFIHVFLYLVVYGSAYGLFYLLPGFDARGILLHPLFLGILLTAAFFAVRYIRGFQGFSEALRRSTSAEKMDKLKNAMAEARYSDVKMKDKDFDMKDIDLDGHREKEGFAYLNALYFDRHRRFYRKPVMVKTGIILVAFAGIFILNIFLDEDILSGLSTGIAGHYTSFIFLMYMLCNSNRETKAMFFNCDLSMMRYGFYRQPKALLRMFTLRLRRIVAGNLIPTMTLILGLLLVTAFSGERDFGGILPVLAMLLALSFFFSIHYIFMYYIFQPYTSSMEVKSPIFNIINGAVYMISYMALQIDAPASGFLPVIILFSGVYALGAVAMVYRMAPKTFRVK